MKEIFILQAQYKALLNFKDEYYGKDFKSNYKFIEDAVKRMIKQKEPIESIKTFLQDAIDVHKRTYRDRG